MSEWKEDARIDFVSEVTINQRRGGTLRNTFCSTTRALQVRIKAIEALGAGLALEIK